MDKKKDDSFKSGLSKLVKLYDIIIRGLVTINKLD